MRIFMTGASGFIGRRLLRELLRRGDQVVALTRHAKKLEDRGLAGGADRLTLVEGDPTRPGSWQTQVTGCDAVVTLAGEPVLGGRWTESFKRRLVESRVEGLRRVVEAIAASPSDRRPKALLAASAVGYYGSRGDRELDEEAGPGSDFLARLCVDWEAAAMEAAAQGVRVVRLRIGVVLGEGGGALEKMLPPFRAFVGGPIGPGDQYLPWIHLDDVVGLFLLALQREEVSGPLNLTAPQPATMGALAKELGAALHRPSSLPVPTAALKLLLGESAQVLLSSQRVLPRQANKLGYIFRYPELRAALRSILG